MKPKLEEKIAKTVRIPIELDRKPGEGSCEYLRRATLYTNKLTEYKETLR